MSTLILVSGKTSTVQLHGWRLPGDQVQALQSADALLREVERRASEQEQVCEAARAQSRVEGLAAARQEAQVEMEGRLAEVAARFIAGRQEMSARMSAQVADLALGVVRRVLGDFEQEDLLRRVARQAIESILDQEPVALRVHPADLAALTDQLSDICPGLQAIPDDRLSPGDCVFDTRHGQVRAGLNVQLAAVAALFQRGSHEQ